MKKLLLSALILSAAAAQARPVPTTQLHMPASMARATGADHRACNDPETQVGDGSLPGLVAAPADETDLETDTAPEPVTSDIPHPK